MNLLELKAVELSGKIVLLEEKHKEVIESFKLGHCTDLATNKPILDEWFGLKAELKAVEAKLNITNQIEEVK